MPIAYELTPDLLRFAVRGDIDHQHGLTVLNKGLEAATDAMRRGHGPPRPVLFDIRESEESRGADEIRAIAMVLGGFRESLDGRAAVVVSKPLYYGVSRMFGAFVESYGIQIEVFGNLEEAEEWLAQPPA